MATPINQLKGTDAEIAAYTPGNAVIVVNETTGDIHVGNGTTPGGVEGKGILQRAKDYADAGSSGETITVATVEDLKSIVPSAGMVRYLKQDGRFGFFSFRDDNLSAMVSADPAEGCFIAPTADAAGASGAWVRQFDGDVHAVWFGLSATGAASSNTTAINHAINLADILGCGVALPGYQFDVFAGAGGGIVVKSRTHLYGKGRRTTIINAIGGGSLVEMRNYQAGSVIRRQFNFPGTNQYVQDVLVEKLAIVLNHPSGSATATAIQIAVDFRNVTRSIVRECHLGNYHPLTDNIKGGVTFTRAQLCQGYAVATGNESGDASYAGGEVNLITENFIAGLFRAVVIDDNNLNPVSAAYSQRIERNDIQIAQLLIYQASAYGAGNVIRDNTLQSVQVRVGNTDTITCGIWMSGYGNLIEEAYGEYGAGCTFILRFHSSAHNNRAKYSGTCSVMSGLVTEGGHYGFRDAVGSAGRNVIEFFADSSGGGGSFTSGGAPQRMIGGTAATQT